MWMNLTREQVQWLRLTLTAAPATEIRDGIIMKANELLRSPTDEEKEYLRLAMEGSRDGELEVDEEAVVSVSDDGGVYVMAWKWIDGTYCEECGAMEGTPEWGTVGDGYDGLCANCADKEEEEE